MKTAHRLLPARVRSYIEQYDDSLPDEVRDSHLYEFKMYLLRKVGTGNKYDAAMEFVNVDDLDEDQREAIEKSLVLIRDRHQGIRFKDEYRPSQVVAAVGRAIPWVFNMSHHTSAWHYYSARPENGSVNRAHTNPKYCVYDKVHGDYVYTQAWVDMLIDQLTSEEVFTSVTGKEPSPNYEAS